MRGNRLIGAAVLSVVVAALLAGCGGYAEARTAEGEAESVIRRAGLEGRVFADYACSEFQVFVDVVGNCVVDVALRSDDLAIVREYEALVPDLLDIARRNSTDPDFQPATPTLTLTYRGNEYSGFEDVDQVRQFDETRRPGMTGARVGLFAGFTTVRLRGSYAFRDLCGFARDLGQVMPSVTVQASELANDRTLAVQDVTQVLPEGYDTVCDRVSRYLEDTGDAVVDDVYYRQEHGHVLSVHTVYSPDSRAKFRALRDLEDLRELVELEVG